MMRCLINVCAYKTCPLLTGPSPQSRDFLREAQDEGRAEAGRHQLGLNLLSRDRLRSNGPERGSGDLSCRDG